MFTYDHDDFRKFNFYVVLPKSKSHWSGDRWETGYPCCVSPAEMDNCSALYSPDVAWFTADDVRRGSCTWNEKAIWDFADACVKLSKNN